MASVSDGGARRRASASSTCSSSNTFGGLTGFRRCSPVVAGAEDAEGARTAPAPRHRHAASANADPPFCAAESARTSAGFDSFAAASTVSPTTRRATMPGHDVFSLSLLHSAAAGTNSSCASGETTAAAAVPWKSKADAVATGAAPFTEPAIATGADPNAPGEVWRVFLAEVRRVVCSDASTAAERAALMDDLTARVMHLHARAAAAAPPSEAVRGRPSLQYAPLAMAAAQAAEDDFVMLSSVAVSPAASSVQSHRRRLPSPSSSSAARGHSGVADVYRRTQRSSHTATRDGEELINSYCMRQFVGRGTTGCVFLATHRDSHRSFAIKSVPWQKKRPFGGISGLFTGRRPSCSVATPTRELEPPHRQRSGSSLRASAQQPDVVWAAALRRVSAASSGGSHHHHHRSYSSTPTHHVGANVSMGSHSLRGGSRSSNNLASPLAAPEPVDLGPVEREIRTLRRLEHPSIVKLHEVVDDEEEGFLHLVLDYIPGGPITAVHTFDAVLGVAPCDVVRPLSRLRRYCCEIVVALHYLHSRRVVHGDLKPDNILRDAGDHVILTDFGESVLMPWAVSECDISTTFGSQSRWLSARCMQGALGGGGASGHGDFWARDFVTGGGGALTPGQSFQEGAAEWLQPDSSMFLGAGVGSDGRLVGRRGAGTPAFSPPELVDRNECGYKTDVWSFGVILYGMLFGRLPFAGPTLRDTFTAVLAAELEFPPLEDIPHSAELTHDSLEAWKALCQHLLAPTPADRLSLRTLRRHPLLFGAGKTFNVDAATPPPPAGDSPQMELTEVLGLYHGAHGGRSSGSAEENSPRRHHHTAVHRRSTGGGSNSFETECLADILAHHGGAPPAFTSTVSGPLSPLYDDDDGGTSDDDDVVVDDGGGGAAAERGPAVTSPCLRSPRHTPRRRESDSSRTTQRPGDARATTATAAPSHRARLASLRPRLVREDPVEAQPSYALLRTVARSHHGRLSPLHGEEGDGAAAAGGQDGQQRARGRHSSCSVPASSRPSLTLPVMNSIYSRDSSAGSRGGAAGGKRVA